MGWWNLIKNANNAEGIREAMRMSYDKHLKLAMTGKITLKSGSTPHFAAIYGALASRFLLCGVPVDNTTTELLIWADLLPFMYLDQHISREALAEYVVYKEMPKDANISWLTTIVQQGCQIGNDNHEEEYNTFITFAKNNGAIWLLLLDGCGETYYW